MMKNLSEKFKLGTLFFLVGLVNIYLAIYRPLHLARNGAPSVMTSKTAMFIAPIVTMFGATYILFPKFAEQHLGNAQLGKKTTAPLTRQGNLFSIAIFIIGICSVIWTSIQLKTLGYK